jgi:hypothetical protein
MITFRPAGTVTLLSFSTLHTTRPPKKAPSIVMHTHTQPDEDALRSAAQSGNDAEVTRLLGKGVDVDCKEGVIASF